MNANTAIVCGITLFVALLIADAWAPKQLDRTTAIGIECVKAGSEWVSRWGIYECVRKGED